MLVINAAGVRTCSATHVYPSSLHQRGWGGEGAAYMGSAELKRSILFHLQGCLLKRVGAENSLDDDPFLTSWRM